MTKKLKKVFVVGVATLIINGCSAEIKNSVKNDTENPKPDTEQITDNEINDEKTDINDEENDDLIKVDEDFENDELNDLEDEDLEINDEDAVEMDEVKKEFDKWCYSTYDVMEMLVERCNEDDITIYSTSGIECKGKSFECELKKIKEALDSTIIKDDNYNMNFHRGDVISIVLSYEYYTYYGAAYNLKDLAGQAPGVGDLFEDYVVKFTFDGEEFSVVDNFQNNYTGKISVANRGNESELKYLKLSNISYGPNQDKYAGVLFLKENYCGYYEGDRDYTLLKKTAIFDSIKATTERNSVSERCGQEFEDEMFEKYKEKVINENEN